MTVDRIGHVEPILSGKKPGRSEQVGGNDKADTINLSANAMEKAERYQVLELIKAVPDLEEARIVELRQKLDDPSYMDGAVKGAANNLLNAWYA